MLIGQSTRQTFWPLSPHLFNNNNNKKALFWEEANYKFKIWTADREPKREETKVDHGWGINPQGPGKGWPRGKETFQESWGQPNLPYLLSRDHCEARVQLPKLDLLLHLATSYLSYLRPTPFIHCSVLSLFWHLSLIIYIKRKESPVRSQQETSLPLWVTKTVWSRSCLHRCSQTNQPGMAQ